MNAYNKLSIKNIIHSNNNYQLEVKLLLKYLLGLNSARLIICYDYVLSDAEYCKFEELLLRLKSGEPVHYIIGEKEFYSRKFKVNKYTLIPRADTEILVEVTLNLAKPKAKILELGTGSGIIAITCVLERPDLEITALDKDLDALEVARQNAHALNAQVRFIQSDWFSELKSNDKFDYIITNPPYIAIDDVHLKALTFEPQLALTDGANGLTCIEHIIKNSIKFLNKKGYLILEHGYDQAQQVRDMFNEYGYLGVTTIQDYAMNDRVTFGLIS